MSKGGSNRNRKQVNANSVKMTEFLREKPPPLRADEEGG
jgi:hypothetical protein